MNRCESCNVYVESGDTCPLCGERTVEVETDAQPNGLPEGGQDQSGRREPGSTQARGRARTAAAGAPAGEPDPDSRHAAASADADSSADPSTVRNARIWVFEMVSLVAFISAIIVFAADFAFGFAVTWSRYPLLAIGSLYLFAVVIIGLSRWPVMLLLGETGVVALFLFGLNILLPGQDWFAGFALPITVLFSLVVGTAAGVVSWLKINSLQALSVWILGTGFFVVGVEIVVSLATNGSVLVSWSLVALACCISIFFLVLFINRRLRERHAEFRKIFHI